MVIGTTLMKLDGTAYYGPEFPRGGLAATFAVDVEHLSSGAGIDISIEHRNADETTWTNAGSFPSLSTTGPDQLDVSGLKEWLRFSYIVTGANASDAVHFLVQAPSWRPYA